MGMLIQEIRYCVRKLAQNLGFLSIAVFTIALGIGANSVIFSIVNGVLLRPLPFHEPDRLLMVSATYGGTADSERSGPFSPGDFLEWRDRSPVLESMAAYAPMPRNLTGQGEPVRVQAAGVTGEFFPTLGVSPVLGRTLLPEDEAPGHLRAAALSAELWRNRFGGDPAVAGKPITLDGDRYLIVGVMPPGFAFPGASQVWTTLSLRPGDRANSYLQVIARLRQDANIATATQALSALASQLRQAQFADRQPTGATLISLHESVVGSVRRALLIFLGAVGVVLLIACANVANLLLVRSASRRKETAIRTALGANRWRLARLSLLESLLLSLIGGTAGLLLSLWGTDLVVKLVPPGTIPRIESVRLDLPVLAFTLGLCLLTTLLFGLAPAFQASQSDPAESLKAGQIPDTSGSRRLRAILVTAEIALSLVLLVGAGLLLRSFALLRGVNPGFHPESVITMNLLLPEEAYGTPARAADFQRRTLEQIRRLAGVTAAGAVNWLPLGGALINGDFSVEGQPTPEWVVSKTTVTPGYFRAMGIPLLEGRDFSESDAPGSPEGAIVTASLAKRLWPGESATGKRVKVGFELSAESWRNVVGVVGDVKQTGLGRDDPPAVYLPYQQVSRSFLLTDVNVVVRTPRSPASVAAELRRIVHGIDGNQPVESIRTMEQIVDESVAEPRFQTTLLTVFSVLALVLAAIGLYGVMACLVAQRTPEIGIRMALGARQGDVLHLVVREGLTLALAGLFIGLAASLALTRLLKGFLFGIKTTDPLTYCAIAALLLGVALTASYLPARRATRVDPLIALRYE